MSSRRARYADDQYDDEDDPRAHRSKEMRSSRRPPTPPSPDEADSPATRQPQRKSILVDPNEDPKDKAARRRSRSNSRVRVAPPPSTYHSSDNEGSIDGRYVKHRNGKVEFIPNDHKSGSKKHTHDLERKIGEGNKSFRDKRDGYTSDEGEQLRRSSRRDRGGSIGDVDDDEPHIEKPKGRSAWDSAHVRPRKNDKDDGAFVIPDRTRRRRESGGRDEEVAAGRRRDLARRHYSDSDDEPPPRRSQPPRKSYDYSDHDRGYDTEGARQRRRGWDDNRDDRRDNRRSARFDDDHLPRRAPPREDRLRPPAPRGSRYDDDYDRRRDDRPIRRSRSDARSNRYGDRDRDRRVDRDPRDKRNEWAKQAGAIFMSQAMPVIKREGGKWARKELENWVSQRR